MTDVARYPIDYWRPLLPQFERLKIELDQRMQQAWAMTARAQLLEYRDWFEEKANRKKLIDKIGMEIFRPRLAVVIGRSTEFDCGIDRQKLSARNPEIDVVTYDDILAYAKKRMVAING